MGNKSFKPEPNGFLLIWYPSYPPSVVKIYPGILSNPANKQSTYQPTDRGNNPLESTRNIRKKGNLKLMAKFTPGPCHIFDHKYVLKGQERVKKYCKAERNGNTAINIPWKCRTFCCVQTGNNSIYNATAASLKRQGNIRGNILTTLSLSAAYFPLRHILTFCSALHWMSLANDIVPSQCILGYASSKARDGW